MSLTTNVDAVASFKNSPNHSPSPLTNLVFTSSFLPSVPYIDTTLNIITFFLIFFLFFLSFLSLYLIFLLNIRCLRHRRLRGFASHSPPRLLLVTLVSLWAAEELIRLPWSRNSLPASEQAHLCKLHVVLSLGFFEPGFLVSLLFLINTSLHTRHAAAGCSCGGGLIKGLSFVLSVCCPICAVLYITTYRLKTRVPFPNVFYHSATSFLTEDGNEAVLCTYPLLSAAVFGAFGVLYAVALIFKCWKVISMAINKHLACRINLLSFAVLLCLTIQVVLMSFSVFFKATQATYYLLMFVIFVSVLVCAALGEFILVIIPILDALYSVVGRTNHQQQINGIRV